jgi:ABC-2 type transport system permease protein
MKALLKLTWLETKIFVREPMGVFGTIGIPVIVFVVASRLVGPRVARAAIQPGGAVSAVLPVLASILMALSAISSLVTIISIYREGGILKRLRATPLTPAVILAAHVLVKLVFTGISLLLMVLAGRRFYPVTLHPHVASFALAVVATTLAILCMGFVIASMVPTARFAQLIGSVVFYPMLAVSGIFVPLASMPRSLVLLGNVLPMSHAVALLRGAWVGTGWLELLPHLGALALTIAISLGLTTRVFRWE